MNIGKANPAHLFQKVLKEQEHEMSILNFININFGMIFYFDHGCVEDECNFFRYYRFYHIKLKMRD